MEKIYENIHKLRLERGWSQSELAKKVGYTSKAAICRIEKGLTDLPLAKVEAFADVFGVYAGDLMGDVEPKVEIPLTAHERDLIFSYRKNPAMQEAIDRILGIEKRDQGTEKLSNLA